MLTPALVTALVMFSAPPAQCPAGQTTRGDLGIRAVACDCTVRAPRNGAPADWRFRGLPTVTAIDAAGPASGPIQVGDEIVAIDGLSLLTPEGGQRFANVSAGASVNLTIRRAGRERVVTLGAASLCSADARLLERSTPQMRPSSRPSGTTRLGPLPVVPSTGMSLPWFGWALACSGCGWEQERGDMHPRWESLTPPVVHAVEPDGPAARAGLRPADKVLAVGGVPITSAKGGAMLGAATPGQAIDLLIERDGRRFDVRLVTDPPRGRAVSRAPLPERYRGRLGQAEVEVDSADPVTVSLSEDGTEILISTATTTVRLKMAGRK